MDATNNATADTYILVAAILHMIDEIERRIDGDVNEHPIDAVLHNLVAAAHALAELAPNDGTARLLFRHVQRPEHWDFESWFSQKAGSLAEDIDEAVAQWSRFTAVAEAQTMEAVDEPFEAFERALTCAQVYASLLHDQIVDDGLVIVAP